MKGKKSMHNCMMFECEKKLAWSYLSTRQKLGVTSEQGEVWFLHMQLEINSIVHLMNRDDKHMSR